MLKQSNSCVHNLTIHLIFVVKYRKKLLIPYGNEVKRLLEGRTNMASTWEIQTMEVDKDHVHMMINYYPNESISNIVRHLKSYTTYHLWQNHSIELGRQFWKKRMFWSPSYFVCTIGDASRATVEKYIETQGGKAPNIHPRC